MRNASAVDGETLSCVTLIGVAADRDGGGPAIAANAHQFVFLGDPAPQGHRHAISHASIRLRPRPNVAVLAGCRTDGVVARAGGRCTQLLLWHRRGNGEARDYGKQWSEQQSAHFFPLTYDIYGVLRIPTPATLPSGAMRILQSIAPPLNFIS